jgi:DNA-binding response OmpR family regulator
MNFIQNKKAWRILLIEDDPAIGEPLKELLDYEGYQIVWESSAPKALEALQGSIRSQDKLPHLILLDIMMPEMDGWEFREKQLAMETSVSSIPVFILSADRRAESRANPQRNEFFFPKPIDMDELAHQIDLKLKNSYSAESRI